MNGKTHPGAKVIMLTTFDMDEYIHDALRAGASGFLLKDAPPEQLVDGIRSVVSGESLLYPAITRRLIEVTSTARSPTRHLSCWTHSPTPESERS